MERSHPVRCLLHECKSGAIFGSEYSLQIRDELIRQNRSDEFAPVPRRLFPSLVLPPAPVILCSPRRARARGTTAGEGGARQAWSRWRRRSAGVSRRRRRSGRLELRRCGSELRQGGAWSSAGGGATGACRARRRRSGKLELRRCEIELWWGEAWSGAGGASRRARSSATRADPGRGQSSAAQRIGLRRTDLGGSATNPAARARWSSGGAKASSAGCSELIWVAARQILRHGCVGALAERARAELGGRRRTRSSEADGGG